MLLKIDPNKTIQKITARIQVGNIGQGTAILYSSIKYPDFIYVITALHCLMGKDFKHAPIPSQIKIDVLNKAGDGKYLEIQLDEEATIFHDEDKDIAVIKVKKTSIELLTGAIPYYGLTIYDSKINEVKFSGFPIAYKNDSSQLVLSHILQQIGNEIQIEPDFPLQSDVNVTQDTFEGFSGSGIFVVQPNNQIALLGVITATGEWKRFTGIDISLLNSLLIKNGLKEEPLIEIETNQTIYLGIETLNQNTKATLEHIRDKIGDIHLEREELLYDSENILLENHTVIITGNAGSGKSALAKEIINQLMATQAAKIFAFKGEQLAKSGIIEVFSILNINSAFEDILDSPLLEGQKIIWIESVEKLIEGNNQSVLRTLLNLSTKRSDITLLITIRSYSLEPFRLKFLLDFPGKTKVIQVPSLTQEEKEQILLKYPKIQAFIKNIRIQKLLSQPFYLDYALKIAGKEMQNEETISEKEFKDQLWIHIIENGKPQRAIVFEELALKRVKEKVIYTESSIHVPELIELVADNLLIEDIVNTRHKYAPAHDIFEDLALVRYVDRLFEQTSEIEDFFASLGEVHAIRRGFRFWLQNELEDLQSNVNKFILECLANERIAQNWKDEVIVAILQSSYCEDFFKSNTDELLKNEAKLLRRFVHLLRTACREPFQSGFSEEGERRFSFYSALFLPKGRGWETIIKFFNIHFSKLESIHLLILAVLIDWQNKLWISSKLPSESRQAGELLLNFLNPFREPQNENKVKLLNKENLSNSISLLFKLTEVMESEVASLIREAKNRSAAEEKLDYWIRDFYDEIFEKVLSFQDSHQVSKFLPELVLEVAEWKWKYKEKPDGYNRYGYNREIEQDFGLEHNYKLEYFPASAFQTPIWHLLRFHPNKTILFIINLIDYSTLNYVSSEFSKNDEVEEVELILNDGTKIKQWGSYVLWCMYRGTAKTTPYLLQSILMALEKWLFSLAEMQDEEINKRLIKYYTILLKASNSVAITSVLASLSMAFPEIIKEEIATIFFGKSFFS